VAISQESRVVMERKMRVDTMVVETDIHYPTCSTLPNDGVRALTRNEESNEGGGRRGGDEVARLC
jgi:hypothetical protein